MAPPTAPAVRPARPDDEATLRRLQQHLDQPAPALLGAALAGTLGECLVAVDDVDTPVGYLLAVTGDGGVPVASGTAADALEDGTPTTHVAELVVAPEARRNGHASALLATVLSTHPTATVTLTVAPANEAARALYDRFGFEVSRTLPGFFDDGPGLLLARRPRPE
jgi:ribosomal protein S18 acetylase RimI-like enzyme